MNEKHKLIEKSDNPVLISFAICPFVQRSVIILNHAKIAHEVINIDLSNKPSWFLDLSPTGKVPVLVTKQDDQKDKSIIFESNIINEYFNEQFSLNLLADSALQRAELRSWISYSESLIFAQYKAMAATDLTIAKSLSKDLLNGLLKLKPKTSQFFDGHALSLVDAALAPLFVRLKWMPDLYQDLTLEAKKSQYGKNLIAWVDNLSSLEAVSTSVAKDFDQQYISYFTKLNSALMADFIHQSIKDKELESA